jgi:hypothetical protein
LHLWFCGRLRVYHQHQLLSRGRVLRLCCWIVLRRSFAGSSTSCILNTDRRRLCVSMNTSWNARWYFPSSTDRQLYSSRGFFFTLFGYVGTGDLGSGEFTGKDIAHEILYKTIQVLRRVSRHRTRGGVAPRLRGWISWTWHLVLHLRRHSHSHLNHSPRRHRLLLPPHRHRPQALPDEQVVFLE